jgi:hypothetical protein
MPRFNVAQYITLTRHDLYSHGQIGQFNFLHQLGQLSACGLWILDTGSAIITGALCSESDEKKNLTLTNGDSKFSLRTSMNMNTDALKY